MLTNYNVKRQGREFIGDSVARVLNELEHMHPRIVAVVPRMLAPFGHNQQEVVEVDLLVEHTEACEPVIGPDPRD